MKKILISILIYVGFVLFCAAVLIFVQEVIGYDLFSPVITEIPF